MSYTILIVDDSAVIRMVLKKTIGMTDVPIKEILEASNGREAIEVLKGHHVDLVMADLNMPEMNGREMTAKILSDEATRDIPIVVVSTEASATRIDELWSEGIKQYVHKPFVVEHIRDVLLQVLAPSPA